jgi:hypothetical protein
MKQIDIDNLLNYLAKFIDHEIQDNSDHANWLELLTKAYRAYDHDLASKKLPNIPAECEDTDCPACGLLLSEKREYECPFVEAGYAFQDETCPSCGSQFLTESLEGVDYPGGSEDIVYRYNCVCGLHIEEVFERTYFQVIGD